MSGGPVIEISIGSAQWSQLPDVDQLAAAAIGASLQQSRRSLQPGAEVSILLCDDRFIQGLNAQWRGRDAPTNVLSFPAPGPFGAAPVLGDIAIAFETTAREAADEGKTIKDHFIHLLVHGFLHLLGYDHQDEADAAVMEGLERDSLAALGIADPYSAAFESVG